jgi:tetratricopeptide (TPR) repeat protein
MRRGACVLIALGAIWGCGPKRVDIDPAIAAARRAAESRAIADERLSEGCYDCLLEAKARYERLAAGPDRPATLIRLFEVQLLLALREKELAIDHATSLAAARAIARELPAAIDANRYLSIVEAVPPDVTGVAAFRDINWRRDHQAVLSRIDAEVGWLLTDAALQLPVRQYFALALDCLEAGRRRFGEQTPRQPLFERIPGDLVPLVNYRIGICNAGQSDRLEVVRALVPRYAEAAYVLARQQLTRAEETGGLGARQLLAESHGRFPGSRSIAYLSGTFQQLVGDCKEALRYYDETLALEREHDNALLGRAICLAFLERFDESIAASTDIITIKPTTLAYGFYWRAWVHHHLGRLEPARADIEQAKAITSANDILRLAGMIEYDQGQLDVAEKDLVAAKRALGGRNDCIARWYLGLVEMKRERWSESGVHFEDAMLCYEGNVIIAEDGLKKVQAATNMDEAFKARQIAGFQAVIKEATSQQYASAFNAANHFARAAELAKARRLLDIADKDPELQTRVKELRKIIGGFLAQ